MGASRPAGSVLRFEAFDLDVKTGELRKAGTPVSLPPQPLKILSLLASRSGELVTREEIQKHIWGSETFVDFEQGLNFAIKKIRSVLGDDAETPRFIETLPRRGYRFIAPVENATSPVTPTNEPITGRFTREAVTKLVDAVLEQHRSRKLWKGIAAALVGAALVAGLFALNPVAWRSRLLGRPRPLRIHSVVVLPLENLSGNPAQDYFADGMTDELITDLAKIGSLRVISRTSSMRYKGSGKPLSQIAHELNVDAVIEGTVRRSGETVRITAQLIHAPSDRHLWAETYERRIHDAVALQGEVAETIADQVRVKLSPDERERLGTVKAVNPMAHDSYLRGRLYLSEHSGARALDEFNRAISLDPTYAPAYAGLADTYSLAALVYSLPPREAFPRAEAAAKKALELDGGLADAHRVLGYIELVYHLDWGASDREFHRALSLNPNAAEAYQCLAIRLAALGRREEAVAAIRRALECDPLSPEINADLGWILYFAREYDQAIKQLKITLELNPEFGTARFFLGQAYEQDGQYDQAIAQFKKMNTESAGPHALAALAHTYAVAGRAEAARKTLEEIKALNRRTLCPPSFLVPVYAALGQKAEAFVNLEKAFEERDSFLIYVNVDPRFDTLHSDARFQAMLRRLGLSN